MSDGIFRLLLGWADSAVLFQVGRKQGGRLKGGVQMAFGVAWVVNPTLFTSFQKLLDFDPIRIALILQ